MKTDAILSNLKEGGYRMTRVRRAVVAALSGSAVPLSALDLKTLLSEAAMRVNKTTVYREIAFLMDRGVIHEIQFGDGKMRYRVCPEAHHHHAICVRCSRVEEITMENDMKKHERAIARRRGFKVLSHTLEFFGLCNSCNGK
ncbi:MAG: transcriptional repressor [Deltaproteobacteria bacterium]|nr:transcriptional repressor [Deltaproteobacteria bacterium]